MASGDLHTEAPLSAASIRRWKAGLIVFAAFALVHNGLGMMRWERGILPGDAGTLGADLAPAESGAFTITRLADTSPLAAAGAKPGDRIAFDRRADTLRDLGTDEEVGLTLTGATGGRHLAVRPAAAPMPRGQQVATVINWIGATVMLGVGLLIGWRRADNLVMRALAVNLLSQTLTFAASTLPAGPLQAFSALWLKPLSTVLCYSGAVLFAFGYAFPALLSRKSARAAFVAYAFVLLAAKIASVAPFLGLGTTLALGNIVTGIALVSAAGCIAALLRGWRAATGVRRQRLAWLALGMSSIYAVFFTSMLGRWMVWSPPWSDAISGLVVTAAITSLGYGAVRHRILDFGFAVNRAMVYATTSLLLAAAFMLAAQLVNRGLRFGAREDNHLLDIAIGLGIALMARQVIRWVDPKVQRIFFRRWHAAAAKLARFRLETIHGMEPEAMQVAFLEAVTEYSGAAGSALYVATPGGALRRAHATLEASPPSLPAQHALVVALASGDKALLGHRDALPDNVALALPMKAHGRLVGAVLVGAKPGGEAFRPDEVKQLATSAQQVGLELELARLRELDARQGAPHGKRRQKRGGARRPDPLATDTTR